MLDLGWLILVLGNSSGEGVDFDLMGLLMLMMVEVDLTGLSDWIGILMMYRWRCRSQLYWRDGDGFEERGYLI